MSIKLMQAVLDSKAETPAEKLVLLAIANYADDEGNNVYPSKQTLADKTGLDTRTVQRICAKLIERKVLVVVQEALRRPTIYRLDVGELPRLEMYRRAAGRPEKLPAPVQKSTGPSAESTGVTPPNPSEKHQPKPSDKESARAQDRDGDLTAQSSQTVEPVPDFAKDWPTLHVKDGDYEVREPYASCPELREAMIEWVKARKADKRKGMPTVYGLRVTNCGWWDKYPLAAVVHAVQRAAGGQWQGIIEDVAREWKPEPGSAASVNGKSVRHGVQTMVQTMEQRQQMIRAAAAQSGQAHALGAGNESEA